MRDIQTVIVLSVVAIVLALGSGAYIAINPLAVLGLVPMLTAIALIISVTPTEPDHPAEPVDWANQGQFSRTLDHDDYTITKSDEIVGVGPQLPQGSRANLTDSAANLEQLGYIQRAIIDDPVLAVGVVLTWRGLPVDDNHDVSALVEQAQQALGLQKGVSWMKRRDFEQHIAGLALGIVGTAGLDVDRLTALLPQAELIGTRRIGAADVEVIEQITATFRIHDFTHGSGLIRNAAVAQLLSVLPLLKARVSPEARPRLLLATADLATQAGWMSFEVKQHDAARLLWMIGLDIARDADHPQAADLTVYLLSDMALQAVHLQRPDEALHLVQIGHTAAAGLPHPVSASTTSLLTNIQARAHAAQGDGAACDRALGQGIEQFSSIDPATAPPWTAYIGEAGLAGHQGAAHYALALAGRDQRAVGRAARLLSHAVDRYGPGYARLRGLYLPDLAGAQALAGNLDTAVTVGHQAIDAATAVSSPRAHDRLRDLYTKLEPLHNSPGVAELRDRLSATAA